MSNNNDVGNQYIITKGGIHEITHIGVSYHPDKHISLDRSSIMFKPEPYDDNIYNNKLICNKKHINNSNEKNLCKLVHEDDLADLSTFNKQSSLRRYKKPRVVVAHYDNNNDEYNGIYDASYITDTNRYGDKIPIIVKNNNISYNLMNIDKLPFKEQLALLYKNITISSTLSFKNFYDIFNITHETLNNIIQKKRNQGIVNINVFNGYMSNLYLTNFVKMQQYLFNISEEDMDDLHDLFTISKPNAVYAFYRLYKIYRDKYGPTIKSGPRGKQTVRPITTSDMQDIIKAFNAKKLEPARMARVGELFNKTTQGNIDIRENIYEILKEQQSFISYVNEVCVNFNKLTDEKKLEIMEKVGVKNKNIVYLDKNNLCNKLASTIATQLLSNKISFLLSICKDKFTKTITVENMNRIVNIISSQEVNVLLNYNDDDITHVTIGNVKHELKQSMPSQSNKLNIYAIKTNLLKSANKDNLKEFSDNFYKLCGFLNALYGSRHISEY
jgi:hypothetical protein